jgi:peptidoglycan hydrolase CwlO-like protein
LSAEGLAAFAGGLRERARLVLEERIEPLQQRIRALEQSVAALERENAWREQTMAGLQAELAALQGETQAQLAALEGETQALREARDTAAASHDRLLAHHRDVVARASHRFAAAAALPPWKFRTCRSLLREAAAQFATESP